LCRRALALQTTLQPWLVPVLLVSRGSLLRGPEAAKIHTKPYTQIKRSCPVDTAISRVFMNGNSQAVRIPQEFRLSVGRVQVSRNEAGDLVIRPLPTDRGAALLAALNGFDDSLSAGFADQLSQDRQAQPPVQEREPL
jgi:antitoxin VapB